ncbi:hypothetical protein [Janthinobacterium fluminis]|uniref:Flagellar hook-length control protein FliK n=1 Tax=Janthinobacterium fluminis TaxID=2987524 RepID=A0ABT5JVQ3_9BURK|nr:hypothetical protein [Janthinobacterium fluminis]MDC8756510.1 hypothetical protein [Janthinobacterium fluminis]
MAIERIPPTIPLLPQITQRLDVSNATPLAADIVRPLVPLGPYMAAPPDGGAGALPQAQQQAFASLAATVGPDATPHDSSAMQQNQLFFSRQLVWQAPNPATLASSWRVMVKTYGEQYAALQEQARGQHVPGMLLMAEHPAVLREGARPPLAMDTEAWRFAVYGWGGQRLMLRVLARDDDEDAGAPKRQRGKVALRLELLLDDMGRVLVQMEPAGDGILLDLAAANPAALLHVRRLLPQLAEAIARSGLRVLRCHINRSLQAGAVHNNYPMQAAAAALSLPLFRAMAEVALLLTRSDEHAAPAPQETAATPEPAEPELEQVLEQALLEAVPAPMNLEPDLEPDPELEMQMELQLEWESEAAPQTAP